jgi:hypothetical protein
VLTVGADERDRSAGGRGLPWAAALGSARNEQCHLSIKQNFQTALNLNQPNGGLSKLQKFQIKYVFVDN